MNRRLSVSSPVVAAVPASVTFTTPQPSPTTLLSPAVSRVPSSTATTSSSLRVTVPPSRPTTPLPLAPLSTTSSSSSSSMASGSGALVPGSSPSRSSGHNRLISLIQYVTFNTAARCTGTYWNRM
jgi:hypothetical protein